MGWVGAIIYSPLCVSQREIQLNEKLQETLNRLMQAKAEQRESEKETRFKECLNMMKQIFPGITTHEYILKIWLNQHM